MICHEFFIIFLAFYVAFCAYRSSPIRVAETDPSRCRPSRRPRPRPRLWTMDSGHLYLGNCGVITLMTFTDIITW